MTIQEIDKSNEGNSSSRYGAQVRWWVLHTEEGNSTALQLHEWMKSNDVSYHYTSSPGVVVDCVNTDRAAWAVLDANPRTINFCFAGSRSAFSREQWLARSEEIDYAARLFIQDAAKYNPLDPHVIGKDYAAIGRGVAGGIDHSGITFGLGIGSHTDCGPNFPFDYWEKKVNELLAPPVPPPPPRNEIDFYAANTPWLGGRITAGENACPDGVGRWAQFAQGYVYWTPHTGAQGIPNAVFGTWGELGFEAGDLGYPIAAYAQLPAGVVQAFERGVLYRKTDEHGFYVHGAIGERWKRDGFENSKWGWPVTNERAIEGGRVQDFEHGYITWSPDGTLGLAPQDGPDYTIPPTHV